MLLMHELYLLIGCKRKLQNKLYSLIGCKRKLQIITFTGWLQKKVTNKLYLLIECKRVTKKLKKQSSELFMAQS